MKGTLQDLLQGIQARRAILLEGYNDYELHQLRVSVRRLRGLLRFEDSPAAWHLRREWGYLIGHTNPCRDWDTLAERIESMPTEEQPVTLVDAMNEHRASIWKKVRVTLAAPAWDEALQRSEHHLTHRVGPADHPPADADAIQEASRRLRRAWKRVQEQDNNRAWHKLRIAVKDLRYNLDSSGEERYHDAIKLCRLLQEQLGNWHDGIVHGELLDNLDRELGDHEIAARRAIHSLRGLMQREGKRCLEDVRGIMEGRGHTLAPKKLA